MQNRGLLLALHFIVALSAVEESHASRDVRGEPQQGVGPLKVALLEHALEAAPGAPAEDQGREVAAPAGAFELHDVGMPQLRRDEDLLAERHNGRLRDGLLHGFHRAGRAVQQSFEDSVGRAKQTSC